MLNIYYRYYSKSDNTNRPEWFSKELCLKSLVLSVLEAQKKDKNIRISFLIDDKKFIDQHEKKLFLKYQKCLKAKIYFLNLKSNTKSYIYQCKLALKENQGNDKILFVEDDYLFRIDAVKVMNESFNSLPCDYLTPYDHPVRYDYNFSNGVDFPHWENRLYLQENYHFRPQESTCMTFMTSARILKEDLLTHQYFSSPEMNCPNDRELFRSLQNLGDYKVSEIPRLLFGPIPSLATHSHKDFLAPCINWDKETHKLINKSI